MVAPETQIINLAEKMMDRQVLQEPEDTEAMDTQMAVLQGTEGHPVNGQPAEEDSSRTVPSTAKALIMAREENPSQTEAKEEMTSTTTLEWTEDLAVADQEWCQDIGVRVAEEDTPAAEQERKPAMEQTTKEVAGGLSIPARNRKIRRESIPVMDT